jgi:hypothetical protein
VGKGSKGKALDESQHSRFMCAAAIRRRVAKASGTFSSLVRLSDGLKKVIKEEQSRIFKWQCPEREVNVKNIHGKYLSGLKARLALWTRVKKESETKKFVQLSELEEERQSKTSFRLKTKIRAKKRPGKYCKVFSFSVSFCGLFVVKKEKKTLRPKQGKNK